jgi:hypothetical protein
LSFHACFKFSGRRLKFKIFSRYATHFSPSISTRPRASPSMRFAGWLVRISLVRSQRDTDAPTLRNFDTKPQSSYYYEVQPDNRLESVANAHTAADLHVHPVS